MYVTVKLCVAGTRLYNKHTSLYGEFMSVFVINYYIYISPPRHITRVVACGIRVVIQSDGTVRATLRDG